MGIGVILVTSFVVSDILTGQDLREAEAEARRAGVALTADDLRMNAPDASENAAGDYDQAIAAWVAVPEKEKLYLKTYHSWERSADPAIYLKMNHITVPMTKPRLFAAIAAHDSAMRWVSKAQARPRLDWNRKWELGMWLLLPEYAPLKQLAHVMAQDARRLIEAGDLKKGLVRLREIRGMARHLEQEPVWIAFLAGNTLRTIADHMAVDMLVLERDKRDSIQSLKAFIGEEESPDIRIPLRGEAFLAISNLDMMATHPEWYRLQGCYSPPDYTPSLTDEGNVLRIRSIRSSAKAQVLRRFTQALNAAASGDWETTEGIFVAIDKKSEKVEDIPAYFVNQIAPSLGGATKAIGTLEAKKRLGMVVAALTEYELAHGAWPEKLPDLGEVSIDPYSKKPFIYRKEPAGFLLYGVGPDRTDDGGDVNRARDMVRQVNGNTLRRVN